MTKQLSYKQRHTWFLFLLQRDGGFVCFYCGMSLDISAFVYDHLNNDRSDNRPQNLVFACTSCNNKKPYDLDMQCKAIEKLKLNEETNFVVERESEDTAYQEVSVEIDINVSNSQITEQYITESIATNGYIEFSDALNSSVFLCKSKTGHGSQQSVRNYISYLTSIMGPYQIVLDESKKKVIVRRSGN